MTKMPLWILGIPQYRDITQSVIDKYHGTSCGEVSMATAEDFEVAIAGGVVAQHTLKAWPAFERSACLRRIAAGIESRRSDLATFLTQETGKTVTESNAEIIRAIDTFTIASEEALRIGGDTIPMDRTVRGVGAWGLTQRFPIGLCAFIAPFNFPLNLAAHKIAPAIAAGNPFILKPASYTPMSALVLGDILANSGLPTGAFSILPATRAIADCMVTDSRFKLVSFTGSADVGWSIKSRAGKTPVILELGGNAAVIVEDTPDLDAVASRIVWGAFYQAGQSCISVQHIMVNHTLYAALKDRLISQINALVVGDPGDSKTAVGPVIDDASATRLTQWIDSAVSSGASILTGGTRVGRLLRPTLLENVDPGEPIYREEAFGPVAILSAYTDFDEALYCVNRSQFGLQTGIFVSDYSKIMTAFTTLDVGGVIIGEVPAFRLDHTPYGGIKESGLGREGIRSAIHHMTEEKLLVLYQSKDNQVR